MAKFYHGSPEKFKRFEKKPPRMSKGLDDEGMATWFWSDPMEAIEYASGRTPEQQWPVGQQGQDPSGFVYPLEIDDMGFEVVYDYGMGFTPGDRGHYLEQAQKNKKPGVEFRYGGGGYPDSDNASDYNQSELALFEPGLLSETKPIPAMEVHEAIQNGLLDALELKTITPKLARANPLMGLLGEVLDPPALNVGATPDMDAAYAAQDRMNDEGPIFYHGTNIPGITQFKATKTDDDFIPGVSLTPDFESAQIYADEMVERHGGSPIVYEVKIKKGSGPVANLFDVLEQIDPKQQGEFQDEDIIKFLQEGSYIGLDDSGYLSPDPSIRIIDPSLLEILGPE